MLSSAQKASSLIKNTLDIVKETAARENIIELQNIILSLQEKNASLLEKISDQSKVIQKLEAELMEQKNWEKIAEQYSLKNLAPHVFVYAPNSDREDGKPGPYLCANCFHDKRQSILQSPGRDSSGIRFHCDKCGSDIFDYTDREPFSVSSAGRYKSTDLLKGY
jgi:hypothetical protein